MLNGLRRFSSELKSWFKFKFKFDKNKQNYTKIIQFKEIINYFFRAIDK